MARGGVFKQDLKNHGDDFSVTQTSEVTDRESFFFFFFFEYAWEWREMEDHLAVWRQKMPSWV